MYREWHGPEQGPVVLLSSGLGGAAGYWAGQIPALVAAGYRVLAYDQRGTGRSREALPAGYSIAHMAMDVKQLLDAEGVSRCHFIGHALGGLVGLQLALEQPRAVASLVLINAWAAPNPHSARCFEARLALLDHVGAKAYVEAQPIFLYPASWAAAHAERVQAEVDHALAHFPGAETMHARINALRQFDVAAQLGRIEVPTLLSVAKDDALVPYTCSDRLRVGIAGAVQHTLAHGGHAHNVTEAELFNEVLLGFLGR
ncbi:pyrimidine utilization protein D [Pseudomonas sp. NPDC007930]|uniref:pyrimidine utilization protein D n=1 Tax=Pseudomonas sp. NPDC007930 TaxID=3364417 RepID=UPI0036E4E351